MATLPNFFLGRNTGGLTITGQTVSSAGVLADQGSGIGATVSILAVFKTIRRVSTNETENISSTSARSKNNVIIETGTDYEITGLLLANDTHASPTNLVQEIVDAFDYLKIVLTRAGKVHTYYGVIAEYEEGIEGKGGVPFRLQLQFADIGAANPATS